MGRRICGLIHRMNYEKALREAVAAALEAGELLRREFHKWGGPRGAGDHADADTEAEWIIRKRSGLL